MNPGAIIGTLGWIGWIVGIVSGSIQIHLWRRERRIGPAKEQLFEEALRDRKGQYSEEQIADLTKLVGRLERSTKEDIPRQARRVFIESQLEAISETLTTSMQQYENLSRELTQATAEHRELPAELAKAVESTIVRPSVERQRRQKRLILFAIVGILVLLFPQLITYTTQLLITALGISDSSIGAGNVLGYTIGTVVATCLAFAFFGPGVSLFIRRHFTGSLWLLLLFILGWILCTIIVYRSVSDPNYHIKAETEAATLSVILIAIILRVAAPMIASIGAAISLRAQSRANEEQAFHPAEDSNGPPPATT